MFSEDTKYFEFSTYFLLLNHPTFQLVMCLFQVLKKEIAFIWNKIEIVLFCFCFFFFTNFIFCTRLIVIKYSSTESIYNKYTHCQQSSAAILVSRFILKMNITWGHTTVIKHEHCWINGEKKLSPKWMWKSVNISRLSRMMVLSSWYITLPMYYLCTIVTYLLMASQPAHY